MLTNTPTNTNDLCQVTHQEWLAGEFGEDAAEKMAKGISANYAGGMSCTLKHGHDGEHKWIPNTKRKWFTHNGGAFHIKDGRNVV